MTPGTVIARRFRIESLAGSGGMGAVYAATDALDGARVALKLLRVRERDTSERFAREARVLAELSHPGIVRYIAHGTTGDGAEYLAMEWLEGEDLAHRLERGALSIGECVGLGARIAAALLEIHAHGVVHRDVKPANLFLQGGKTDAVKLLDFGVARVTAGTRHRTQAGLAIGTPGYMAPEQARGSVLIGPAADTFALGCVLYECLVGRPAFEGEHVVALLAKILLEDVSGIRESRPEVPDELASLVARMLAKETADRPDDHAVRTGLEAIVEGSPRGPGSGAMTLSLTPREQVIVSAVMVGPTKLESEIPKADAWAETMQAASPAAAIDVLRELVAGFDGRLEPIANGSLIVTLTGGGVATDRANRAAQCALALRGALPAAPIALATGRAEARARTAVGEVIDRAMQVLLLGMPLAAVSAIRIDEVSAGLLDARFDQGRDGRGPYLRAERTTADATRTLVGKPTSCVGRDLELGILVGTYGACVDESVARAALVTSLPGVGKSRLRREFMLAISKVDPAPEVWTVRADTIGAGSAYGLGAKLIQAACRAVDGEPLSVRQDKLRARVRTYFQAESLERVTTFLAELMGAPFAGDDRFQLRAARLDARLMGDQIGRAWQEFIAAVTRDRPLVIVLEDLQWGDLPTIGLIDMALRNSRDSALLVLAFARPEIDGRFPGLWSSRGLQRISLEPLSRRACERLVREVLGAATTNETVARLVARSAGNAFFLEELIRVEAEGRGADLPDTVLAMMQARMESLPHEARLVLRAASIFGESFWHDSVRNLLGDSSVAAGLDQWLTVLTDRELISARRGGRFADQREYAFRHDLVREAAYSTLTSADCALGHRLAAAWLQSVGERNASMLAEHFERGGERAGASRAWLSAAEQAMRGNDLGDALAKSERALACEPVEAGLGADEHARILIVQAEARRWRGEYDVAHTHAMQAIQLVPAGSEHWYAAAYEIFKIATRRKQFDGIAPMVQQLLGEGRPLQPTMSRVKACAMAVNVAFAARWTQQANELAEQLTSIDPAQLEQDPGLAVWVTYVLSTQAYFAGDPGGYLMTERELAIAFARIDDRRNACIESGNVGDASLQIGACDEAIESLQTAIPMAISLGLFDVVVVMKLTLANALAAVGKLEDARLIGLEALEAAKSPGNVHLAIHAHADLARLLHASGDLAGAIRCASEAPDPSDFPGVRAYLLAVRAELFVAVGQITEAVEAAASAMQSLTAVGGVAEHDAYVRLVEAETFAAAGEHDRARITILAARDRLIERGSKIVDPRLREGFFRNVAANARTIARAATMVQ